MSILSKVSVCLGLFMVPIMLVSAPVLALVLVALVVLVVHSESGVMKDFFELALFAFLLSIPALLHSVIACVVVFISLLAIFTAIDALLPYDGDE